MDDEQGTSAQGTNDLASLRLMRSARGVYSASIREQLHAIGADDLPRNGAFVLAEMDSGSGRPVQARPTQPDLGQQAATDLLDILVKRGYLQRRPRLDDAGGTVAEVAEVTEVTELTEFPELTELTEFPELTERGNEVVQAVRRGIEAVDLQLRERVTPEQVDTMRSVLIALAEIKSEGPAVVDARPRPARQFRQISPIFSVRNLKAALAHYAALGFVTIPYEDGDGYGFANRDGLGLHLAVHDDHDHTHCGSAYLYVRDADKLYEEWSRPGVGGHTHPAGPTPYKLREGSHTDPDGNLIRFGSPMGE
jgi:hypothetical protein